MTIARSLYRSPEKIKYIEVSIGELLRQQAQQNSDTIAVTEIGHEGEVLQRVTYHDLYARAHELAQSLSARFDPGQRIILWAPNSFDWILVEYAVLMAGLVLVPLNPNSPDSDLEKVAERSRPAAIFFAENDGRERYSTATTLAMKYTFIREIVDIFQPDQLGKPDNVPTDLPAVSSDHPAFIISTSGSTGTPKGVVLSHHSCLNGCAADFDRAEVTGSSVWGGINPLFLMGGCLTIVLGPLVSGCTLCLFRDPDPLTILQKIESERISGFWSVPTMLSALLTALQNNPRDVSSLTGISSGGAAISAERIREIRKAFGCAFQRSYGLTEIEVSATFPSDDEADILLTSGPPLPGNDVSIRNLESQEIEALNECGEIWVRSKKIALGYVGDPELTENTFADGGWFRTGDIGQMDERGYLTVTGRIKNLIIRGGQNISPEKIENVVSQIEGITDNVVVGIPNKTLGEMVACFFCVDGRQSLTVKDLNKACNGNLARNEVPTVWVELKKLPLTASGKIHRQELISGYQEGKLKRMKIRS